MQADLLTIGISLVVGTLSSWLTFRLQFERFKAKDGEREKHWDSWRTQITADVEALKRSANLTQVALLQQSLETLVKRVEQLSEYTAELKHLHIDPYEREMAKLNQRVDTLERK